MKKYIKSLAIVVALVICGGIYTEANAIMVNTTSQTSISSSYTFVRNVTAVRFAGNARITNSNVKLYSNGDDYVVEFSGKRLSVYNSNRSDFSFMFYNGSAVWYFN